MIKFQGGDQRKTLTMSPDKGVTFWSRPDDIGLMSDLAGSRLLQYSALIIVNELARCLLKA